MPVNGQYVAIDEASCAFIREQLDAENRTLAAVDLGDWVCVVLQRGRPADQRAVDSRAATWAPGLTDVPEGAALSGLPVNQQARPSEPRADLRSVQVPADRSVTFTAMTAWTGGHPL